MTQWRAKAYDPSSRSPTQMPNCIRSQPRWTPTVHFLGLVIESAPNRPHPLTSIETIFALTSYFSPSMAQPALNMSMSPNGANLNPWLKSLMGVIINMSRTLSDTGKAAL